MTPASPHLLDLYRLAVQHPLAEVAFIEHVWAHYYGEQSVPLLLREDFAGTCAVAAAWVASDPDRQAIAIELDEPTAQWAAEQFTDPDLHIVNDDVMAVDEPAVEVTLALNFSVLIYHEREALLSYLRHSCGCLEPGGLLIMDLFGGSSLAKPSVQRRRVDPDEGAFVSFDYLWEQRGLNERTGRIECLIHFELDTGGRLNDAFVYDWRLWRPEEVIELASEAGFVEAGLWWAPPGSGGRFAPIAEAPDEENWVGDVVMRAPD